MTATRRCPGCWWPCRVAQLVGFGVVVALVLSLVGVLVLRSSGRDIAAELRRGEAS